MSENTRGTWIMRSARKSALVGTTVAALVVVLSGCAVSANRTTSPEGLARVVADSLEKSVGQRPEVDCGDDSIDLQDGNVVHCDVNTAGFDTKYDATVEIGDVDGSKYSVDVQVADTPEE